MHKKTETKVSASLSKTFSTTTAVHVTAQNIALLDIHQAYFQYSMSTMCGIPRVTLLGTAKDWEDLASAVKALPFAELDLEFWRPTIADALSATAQGRGDLEFWKSFYKYKSFSGGNAINGWLAHL